MMFPYMYEAQFLVEDGATPEQVDRVLTDWGMAMGIFAVDDMARPRRRAGVSGRNCDQFEEPGARKPLVADELVRDGPVRPEDRQGLVSLRRATGSRFRIPRSSRSSSGEPQKAGITRRAISDEEIVERTIYALINEGARVLEEGIALRAADIDVIYLNGYGFPAIAAARCSTRIASASRRSCPGRPRFIASSASGGQPAPLLARLATAGSTFREFDASRG